MGGMYVANDFQRLMMRKEVENWRGRREKDVKAWRRRGRSRRRRRRKNLELRGYEAVLNVRTAVEVIN